mmetsp:Transcript_38141/g.83372  ORF Transcript_38141/g.83372 Transcript_38141/m.83372 type:complete len:109 (-) Transcript_38141:59-385(-)
MALKAAQRDGSEGAVEILQSMEHGQQFDGGAREASEALRAAVVHSEPSRPYERGGQEDLDGDDDITVLRAERDRYKEELADSRKEVAALLAAQQQMLRSLQDRLGPAR